MFAILAPMLAWILLKLPFLARLMPALSFLRGHGWLVVGLVAGAWIWWQGHRIDGLKEDLAEAEAKVEERMGQLRACWSANASNQVVMQDLRRANLDLSAALMASEADVKEIRENLRRREAEAEKRLSGVLSALEELEHENASCEAFATLDVGDACPAAVQRLREHARAAAGDPH